MRQAGFRRSACARERRAGGCARRGEARRGEARLLPPTPPLSLLSFPSAARAHVPSRARRPSTRSPSALRYSTAMAGRGQGGGENARAQPPAGTVCLHERHQMTDEEQSLQETLRARASTCTSAHRVACAAYVAGLLHTVLRARRTWRASCSGGSVRPRSERHSVTPVACCAPPATAPPRGCPAGRGGARRGARNQAAEAARTAEQEAEQEAQARARARAQAQARAQARQSRRATARGTPPPPPPRWSRQGRRWCTCCAPRRPRPSAPASAPTSARQRWARAGERERERASPRREAAQQRR